MMNPNDIMDGNILIAQFRGWKLDNSYPDKGRVWRSPKGYIELDTTFKFHYDWNLLMDVVTQINATPLPEGYTSIEFTIGVYSTGWIAWHKNRPGDQNQYQYYEDCDNGHSLRFNTWIAVVEFIKWWNGNNK